MLCNVSYSSITTNFRSFENGFKVLSRVAFATKVFLESFIFVF